MVRQPMGQAAIVLECILLLMMCGQVGGWARRLRAGNTGGGPARFRVAEPARSIKGPREQRAARFLNLPSPAPTLAYPTHPRQAADEVKQMLTYKREYFNSPWK
jgi:hypothetical protein